MKKITVKFFRNYLSNIIIVGSLCMLLLVTYAGGVVGVFSSYKENAYYYGNPKNNAVSLMINVYWGNEYIEPMLNTLKNNNVKATFFVGGSWVNKNNDLFLKIYESGNEIGNHGYWHKDSDKLSKDKLISEIGLTDEVVEKLTAYKMDLFAPPSGALNQNTVDVATSLGYKTIMWSKDTIDWRDKDRNLIYNRATKNPKAGDLILMHPTECTMKALDDIIKFYINNGFNLTTVSQNIAI